MGEYASLQFAPLPFLSKEAEREIEKGITALLRKLIPSKAQRLLVVGLGNRRMTVDSIGPRVAEGVTATAILKEAWMEKHSACPSHLISVFCPDVYGETGMETTGLVKAAVSLTHAQAVLAIDAMATANPSHLLRAIEMTDTGTVPGAGIGNRRLPLSRETVGVPVVAIGISTMMRARPRLRRALVDFGVEAGCADSYAKREEGLLLIPSALEEGVAAMSRLTSRAINTAFGFDERDETDKNGS
jgi:spore protease